VFDAPLSDSGWSFLPFSNLAIDICFSLFTVCLMLELQPWRRTPWRTPIQHLVIWFILCGGIVLLTANLSAWFVLFLYNNQGN
jgi:hypothetical protein